MPSPLNKTIRLSAKEKVQAISALPKKITSNTIGIFQGEIEIALTALPKKYFDLIVADPPYNLGMDFGNKTDKRSEEEYQEWVYKWVSLLPSIAKLDASFYICCDWRQSSLYLDALEKSGLTILNRITWKRDKGRGAFRPDSPGSASPCRDGFFIDAPGRRAKITELSRPGARLWGATPPTSRNPGRGGRAFPHRPDPSE